MTGALTKATGFERGAELSLAQISVLNRDASLGYFFELLNELRGYKGGIDVADHLFDTFIGSIVAAPTAATNTEANEPGLGYVAWADSVIVGLGFVTTSELWIGQAELCWFISRKFRNRGFGRQLAVSLRTLATNLGAVTAFCYVPPGARSSKSSCEQNGFLARMLKMVNLTQY